jgi:hypothetical protein
LVLTGTGAHGAYHAGVLRALQEAGVKIDILAGHGVGAGSAALAALDGSARLWDASGIWRSKAAAGLYGWRWPIRAAAAIGIVLLATLLTPLAVLLAGPARVSRRLRARDAADSGGCSDRLVVFGVAAVGVRRTESANNCSARGHLLRFLVMLGHAGHRRLAGRPSRG